LQDRQSTVLPLARGETRRIRVAARTTVLVVSGSVVVRGPLDWLADTMLAPEQRLGPEQRLEFASGGWVDLQAGNGAQVVLLPRESQQLVRRVARYLHNLLP